MNDWLFDLGNSRLKRAPLDAGGVRGDVHAVAHEGLALPPGWDAGLGDAAGRAWIASVAADGLRAALVDALRGRGWQVREAETTARFAGITIAYPHPERLGVDRALAMAAAQGDGDALVVGVGTAMTLDWVDARGRHRGGRIAPSPALMRDALRARSARLPAEGGAVVDFADDTRDALASGCTGAAVALVDAALRTVAARGGDARTWLHGGGAGALLPHLPGARHAPHLVLDGLAAWARAAVNA